MMLIPPPSSPTLAPAASHLGPSECYPVLSPPLLLPRVRCQRRNLRGIKSRDIAPLSHHDLLPRSHSSGSSFCVQALTRAGSAWPSHFLHCRRRHQRTSRPPSAAAGGRLQSSVASRTGARGRRPALGRATYWDRPAAPHSLTMTLAGVFWERLAALVSAPYAGFEGGGPTSSENRPRESTRLANLYYLLSWEAHEWAGRAEFQHYPRPMAILCMPSLTA